MDTIELLAEINILKNQLKSYKDVESKIKIPLITLFTAILNNKIYTRGGHECYVDFNDIEQDSRGDYYFSTLRDNYYLADYDITWANSKEELL